MLKVFICEDDKSWQKRLGSLVSDYASSKDLAVELTYISDNPTDILAHLSERDVSHGLYLLDVDLQHEINGIELGVKIMESDPFGSIVFITTHSELAYLTFIHKVKTNDYILKDNSDNLDKSVGDCIQKAYDLLLEQISPVNDEKHFSFNANGVYWNVPLDEILYIETNKEIGKRVNLYMENSMVDFRGIISEVEQLIPDFYRCHQSFIVNPKKIQKINKLEKTALMTNGDAVLVASRKMSQLIRLVEMDNY